ncbi:helix-turn-helix transcriptional regulator [Halopenitus persicus]|uniref:helix-turn-helix transcriptional regulator n=1 Tax=Halopenitus persicus TaxID=1048396 RepID=UPI000BBB3648|nr:hypothetical protein [Halopenitus persicus]
MTRSRTARTRIGVIALAVAVGIVVLGVTFLAAPGIVGPDGAVDVTNGSDVGTGSDSTAVTSSSTASTGGGSVAAQAVDADTVAIRVDINESGTARWRLEYRVRLDTEERESAFENLSADVAANESVYADRFATRMETTVAAAANATGRSMSIDDVAVETDRRELPESYGVLRYTLEWNGFATVDEDRIVAGDAIAGLFLDSGHRLTIAWPDGYEVDTVRPTPDETGTTSATWTGPAEFADDEPRIVLVPAAPYGIGGTALAGILVVLLLAAGLAIVAYRRRDRLVETFADAPETAAGSAASDDPPRGDRTPADDRSTAVDAESASDAGSDAGSDDPSDAGSDDPSDDSSDAGAAAGSTADAESSESPPEELLSNEERVLRLLRQNGGRMKQQDVVEELGWSDARTSQVVSGLREAGNLDSFRLGRENVLRLPEADAVDSGVTDESGSDDSETRDSGTSTDDSTQD